MRILILSSWVGHGHVGLCAAVPVLQALGHSVSQLPTTILSNHPGWPHVAGAPVPVVQLEAMTGALCRNGWLSGIDAVLTGYFPTPEHVEFAAGLLDGLPGCRAVVDPVLGDDPKGLYVPLSVAEAIRDRLVPRAHVLTPNAFELAWLTGQPCGTLDEAKTAARSLAERGREVVVTSPPVGPDETGLMHVRSDSTDLWRRPRLKGVPHGVGDTLSALLASDVAVSQALGHLDALIRASLCAEHLRIAETAPLWTKAPPILPEGTDHGV